MVSKIYRLYWKGYVRKLFVALRSNKLFWAVFGVFIFEAVWVALSGAYSMSYDEYVHYGIAQIYTHQLSPFFASQPPAADAFGAISRDPSYLYHYLLSWPLRLFDWLSVPFMVQIIVIRFMSIGMFASGILLFRRLLKTVPVSPLVSNLALGFLLLLPVSPLMAAQINYDDMLFPLVALTLLLTLRVSRQLRTERRISAITLLLLIGSATLASLVKYAYAPILLAIAIYLSVMIHHYLSWRPVMLWGAVRDSVKSSKRWALLLAAAFALIGLALFGERYGLNIVRYHSPTPECDQVISLEHCQLYEPYARNYTFHQGNYDLPEYKIIVYPFITWIHYMVRSLFFVVGSKQIGYPAGEPLPLGDIAGYTTLVGGLVLVIWRGRWLWRLGDGYRLFMVVAVLYTGFLFMQNFLDFLHTHVAVAIQGRYLMPILPLYLVLIIAAATKLLAARRQLAAGLLTVLIVCMVTSGGWVPFIVRSQDNWLWNAPIVRQANHAVRDVIAPLTIGD